MSKQTEYAKVFHRFCTDTGLSPADAAEVVRLARRCGTLNTHSVNGENHPRAAKMGDKSESSKLWEQDLERWSGKLAELVGPLGYGVRFDGIYPSLVRNGDTSGNTVNIPLDK